MSTRQLNKRSKTLASSLKALVLPAPESYGNLAKATDTLAHSPTRSYTPSHSQPVRGNPCGLGSALHWPCPSLPLRSSRLCLSIPSTDAVKCSKMRQNAVQKLSIRPISRDFTPVPSRSHSRAPMQKQRHPNPTNRHRRTLSPRAAQTKSLGEHAPFLQRVRADHLLTEGPIDSFNPLPDSLGHTGFSRPFAATRHRRALWSGVRNSAFSTVNSTLKTREHTLLHGKLRFVVQVLGRGARNLVCRFRLTVRSLKSCHSDS